MKVQALIHHGLGFLQAKLLCPLRQAAAGEENVPEAPAGGWNCKWEEMTGQEVQRTRGPCAREACAKEKMPESRGTYAQQEEDREEQERK